MKSDLSPNQLRPLPDVLAESERGKFLLNVEGLVARLNNGARIVDDISFSIKQGETFALLGESGCGKSMTALSLMRLLPQRAAR